VPTSCGRGWNVTVAFVTVGPGFTLTVMGKTCGFWRSRMISDDEP
jgi:hypothetical protein